ncbi:MAG: PAS domain-containing protein [bacterium]|nr:PAS domain-containing protein [bacterium]
MKTNKKGVAQTLEPVRADFVERLWEESWTYIKTVVDVVREPVLILDKDLRVMAANESFYRMFQVELKDTEGKVVYELGNGQWNISSLRKLLEDILPKNTFFKGFEVAHEFPFIGRKVIILNARQIHPREDTTSGIFPPIILLAMEDVTDMMVVAETLASHANHIEAKHTARTDKLEVHIGKLEKQINELKNRS